MFKSIDYKKILAVAGLISILLVPMLASAQVDLLPDKPSSNLPGDRSTDAEDLIGIIIQWLLGIAGLIAVLFIIIGGFRYIVSGGNEEQAEAGKKTLTNAIIGLVVIILAYVIVTVIINTLIR